MKAQAQLLLALGILFFAEIIIFSTAFVKITVVSRYITETSIFSTGDKLDAYVKSYNDALQLSLMQAIYEAGANQQNVVWDNYGQISADSAIASMEQYITTTTTSYAKQFLGNYSTYSTAHPDDNVAIPNSSSLFPTSETVFTPGDWSSMTPGQADLTFTQLTFNLTQSGTAKQTASESFLAEARVPTYFDNMFTDAKTDLQSGQILSKINSAMLQSKTTSSTWCVGWDPTPPTCSAQFPSVYGMSYTQAVSNMNANMQTNLNSLAATWSQNEPYTVIFGNYQTNSQVAIGSNIMQIGTCSRVVNNVTETTDKDQQTCTYTPQGAAKFVFSMKERQNLYSFWYNNSELYDHITLNFTVVDGNARLI